MVPTPAFDLVVATIGRREELAQFLDSLAEQTHRSFRVIVVDQNEDDRVSSVIGDRDLEILRLTSAPGLSRARNVALASLRADIVAFPDDDCTYEPTLLERVAHALADEPALDGLSGRTVGQGGRTSPSWAREPALLTDDNLWNRVNSAALFLRRSVVDRVGAFDERLGLGSGTPSTMGEEIDYVIRAVRGGARIRYEPDLVVTHEPAVLTATERRALGYREGRGVGYLLRRHRYPLTVRARMAIRPLGGAILSLARLDTSQARVHVATLHGRVAGYRSTSSSNSAV